MPLVHHHCLNLTDEISNQRDRANDHDGVDNMSQPQTLLLDIEELMGVSRGRTDVPRLWHLLLQVDLISPVHRLEPVVPALL